MSKPLQKTKSRKPLELVADRGLPCDPAAERAVLGSVLIRNDLIQQTNLESDEFSRHSHRVIWEAMRRLDAARRPIDPVTVAAELGEEAEAVGGIPAIADLLDGTSVTVHFVAYCEAVRTRAHQRALALQGVALADPDATPGEVLRMRAEIEERLQAWTPARPTIRPAGESGAGLLDEWARIAESGELPPRIETGLHDLDFLLGGVRPGEMLVVGARPGCGKTAFAVSLAARIAAEKHVLFFEFEMSGRMLLERFYSGLCQLDSRIFRDPTRFTPEDWQAVTAAQQVVADWRLWISDNQQAEVSEICATVADCRRRGLCDVVVIDYLQLVEASGGFENRQVEVSKISRRLKRMAVEQDVVVVALAQLNREASGEPELRHLRESGAIEADADQVIFLWQEDDPDGPIQATKCKVAKNRSGQVGVCDLMFFKHYSAFFNADR